MLSNRNVTDALLQAFTIHIFLLRHRKHTELCTHTHSHFYKNTETKRPEIPLSNKPANTITVNWLSPEDCLNFHTEHTYFLEAGFWIHQEFPAARAPEQA